MVPRHTPQRAAAVRGPAPPEWEAPQVHDVQAISLVHLHLAVGSSCKDSSSRCTLPANRPWYVRVARQDHRLAPLPGLQPERTVGDDVLHVRPGLAVCLHHVPGHGVVRWIGQQVEEIAGRPLQFHLQGERRRGPVPPPPLDRSLALVEGPAPLMSYSSLASERSGGRIQGPLPGVLKVPRRHRVTITPAHVFPQVKDVLRARLPETSQLAPRRARHPSPGSAPPAR